MNNIQTAYKSNISDKDLNNKSLILAEKVESICQPLFKRYGINGFSYSRIFKDGSRSELWNNADALYHIFLRKKYINNIYTPDNYTNNERYVYLSNKIKNFPDEIRKKYTKQLLEQKELFNNDHCFLIINKNNIFCEYFIFYMPEDFRSAINFYLNHLVELEKFAKNFKEQSKLLIKMADEEKIVKPWRNGYRNIDLKSASNDSNLSDRSTYIKLTKREMQVAQLIIEGKTAKESASHLDISMRTVESYIENIKNKLACNRKGDLIVKLIKSELITG